MKPILFNADLVRAILNGQKTVTRRVVKDVPSVANKLFSRCGEYVPCVIMPDNTGLPVGDAIKPPYQPGDILYVREAWSPVFVRPKRYIYKADADAGMGEGARLPVRWRPSIHMPKEAARIFLRVTGVRVERLQATQKEDVIKEGIAPKKLRIDGCKCAWAVDGCLEKPCANRAAYEEMCYTEPFAELWDSTIKPADRSLYSWAANPWVWVIEFERCEKPEGS